jgi:hypothetical protein
MHMHMAYLFIFSVYVFNAMLSACIPNCAGVVCITKEVEHSRSLNAQIKKNEIG